MELNLKFDSEKKGDLFIAGIIGHALSASSKQMLKVVDSEETLNFNDEEEEPLSSVNEEHNDTQDAPEVEEPAKAEDTPAEAPEVQQEAEKPKRKRRTKAEIEAEKLAKETESSDAGNQSETPVDDGCKDSNEETAQPASVEGEEVVAQPLVAQPELPFDAPEQQGESVNKLSETEWKDLLLKKRIELGLCKEDGSAVGARNADARTLFASYIYEICEPYGASKPKDLSDEVRWKFYHEKFKLVQYDPVKGFYLGEAMPTEPPF